MNERDGGVGRVERVQQLDVGRASARVTTENTARERQEVTQGGNAVPQKADAPERRVALIEAANVISSLVQNISRELRFSVDDGTGRTVLTVLDRTTEQIIRQIPVEEVLKVAQHLQESTGDDQRGILLDSEA